MEYADFLRLVASTWPHDLRYGQHWFNVLYCVRPNIANDIRATPLDPFHRDGVSEETQEYVRTHWTTEQG
jgi:hypothetical protein